MPVNLFCLEESKGRGGFSLFCLFKIYLLVFDLLSLCPLNTPVLNPICLRTPGVPSVVLLLVILLFLLTRLTGVLSVVLFVLVIVLLRPGCPPGLPLCSHCTQGYSGL